MAGIPLVSVCIVTGRRAALLDACLVSLLGQRDAPEFEVLVCSDGDPGVAGTVHRRFPNARVCHVERALPGAARNLLVRRARGDVLLFLVPSLILFTVGLLAVGLIWFALWLVYVVFVLRDFPKIQTPRQL